MMGYWVGFSFNQNPYGLGAASLKTPDLAKKEIAINLLAYNIIRGNLAQAGSRLAKIQRQLSFRSALQILIQTSKQIVRLTGERLIKFLQVILKAMTATPIGKQQRKSQPRALKRQPKPFPLLMV